MLSVEQRNDNEDDFDIPYLAATDDRNEPEDSSLHQKQHDENVQPMFLQRRILVGIALLALTHTRLHLIMQRRKKTVNYENHWKCEQKKQTIKNLLSCYFF